MEWGHMKPINCLTEGLRMVRKVKDFGKKLKANFKKVY